MDLNKACLPYPMSSLDKMQSNKLPNLTQYTGPYVFKDTSDNYSQSEDDESDKYSGFASKDELLKAKLELLQKLGEMADKGIHLTQNYTMNSNYEEIKFEYHLALNHQKFMNQVQFTKAILNAIDCTEDSQTLKKKCIQQFDQLKDVLEGITMPSYVTDGQNDDTQDRVDDDPAQINIEI